MLVDVFMLDVILGRVDVHETLFDIHRIEVEDLFIKKVDCNQNPVRLHQLYRNQDPFQSEDVECLHI